MVFALLKVSALEIYIFKVMHIIESKCFTIYCNITFARWRHFTTTTRMLLEFPFLFKLLLPHENSDTIGAN